MILQLFNTVDDENVINKNMVLVHELNITLKNDVNVTAPIIILNDKFGELDFMKCNYAYLPEFNRYYFIRYVTGRGAGIWNLDLECDVLETYKQDIFNSLATISRPIKTGEYMTSNSNHDVRKTIEIYKSGTMLVKDNKMLFSSVGV